MVQILSPSDKHVSDLRHPSDYPSKSPMRGDAKGKKKMGWAVAKNDLYKVRKRQKKGRRENGQFEKNGKKYEGQLYSVYIRQRKGKKLVHYYILRNSTELALTSSSYIVCLLCDTQSLMVFFYFFLT